MILLLFLVETVLIGLSVLIVLIVLIVRWEMTQKVGAILIVGSHFVRLIPRSHLLTVISQLSIWVVFIVTFIPFKIFMNCVVTQGLSDSHAGFRVESRSSLKVLIGWWGSILPFIQKWGYMRAGGLTLLVVSTYALIPPH